MSSRARASTSQQLSTSAAPSIAPVNSMSQSSFRGDRLTHEDATEDAAYRDFAVRTLSDKRLPVVRSAGTDSQINVSMFEDDDDDDDSEPDFNPDSLAPPPEPEDDEPPPPMSPSSLAPPQHQRLQSVSVSAFRNHSPSPTSRQLALSGQSSAYNIAPDYYEIQTGAGGAVVRNWLTAGAQLRPTERAWQALLNTNDLSSVADCGATVLRLLERHFRELPGPFQYKGQQPSHEWDRDGPADKGLPPKLLARLCAESCQLLIQEPAMVRPAEPCYVLGDLHGNYRDLQIFARAFWPLGIDFTPANVLFLGDYVDRGPHSVEVVAYVLAMKLVAPGKVFLLRGNHEISELNGNEKAYGLACFKGQCKLRYGEQRGEKVWSAFNEVFRFLPVSGLIGDRVFCVHGGIPRSISASLRSSGGGAGGGANVLDVFAALPIHSAQSWTNPTIMDMLWADPATPQEEASGLRALKNGDGVLDVFPDGFAPNKARGPFTCVFGRAVVDQFLQRTGCTHIIRAHQPPRLGVDMRHSGKVITLFSSSHYCGANNAAAAALISNRSIRIVLAAIDSKTLQGEDPH
jgi:diadenosine tetraphosphatase ApaH/serine/threonine PP2A family protein phosphatase